MKLKIKSEVFKEMVSKAVKGASCNKLMPITGMMSIELKSGVLTLITSDASNYLYIRKDKIEGDDFYVTVPVEKFSKLIARMTCEFITLELKSNALEVSGNGTYLIDLPDEEGELIRYPDPLAEVNDPSNIGEITSATVTTILNSAKPSLATTFEVPCYVGYYMGDKVVATDGSSRLCIISTKVFDTAYLVSPETVNLLAVMTAEKINVDSKDNVLIFSSPDCVVYSPIMDGIEDYEIDSIGELDDSSGTSMCKISKSALLQLLDRISLFVNDFDEGAIYLTFTKEGLMIRSKAESGTELIPYKESTKFSEFTCILDIADFITQVKSQPSDLVEIHYGHESVIKTVDGNILQAICLLEEDSEDMG